MGITAAFGQNKTGAKKGKNGMSIVEIILIGVGLSMDAVAVSASNAMCFPRERLRLLEMAVWFAVFQGAMPLAGFLLAAVASDVVTKMGGWLALLILGWVGGQMIRSGLSHEEERCPVGGLTRRTLMVQAVATSIDALAVGVGLKAGGAAIFPAVFIIPVVTLACCLAAIYAGTRIGGWFGRRAELFGGIILVLIGIKQVL